MPRRRVRPAPSPKPLTAFPAKVRGEVDALRREEAAIDHLERKAHRAFGFDSRKSGQERLMDAVRELGRRRRANG